MGSWEMGCLVFLDLYFFLEGDLFVNLLGGVFWFGVKLCGVRVVFVFDFQGGVVCCVFLGVDGVGVIGVQKFLVYVF